MERVVLFAVGGGGDPERHRPQAEILKSAPAEVDLRVVPKAGHFSFVHLPPPGMDEDPAFDRDGFLDGMVRETFEFVSSR